jgi:aspartate aminotransferase
MIQRSQAPSPTLLINEQVHQKWDRGQTIYHLAFGESRMPVHPKLIAALEESTGQRHYLPSLGLPALREAVAGFYRRHLQIPATADRVVIGPGSKALMYAIQLALRCQVYLPVPSWVSYQPQAALIGNQVIAVPSSLHEQYAFRLDSLERVIDKTSRQPKLLVINSPNNPSGRILDADFLQSLAGLCRANDMLVLSDEIYALITYDGQPHVSLARFYPEGTIVVGGLSKQHSLGGWRLGVALFPDSTWGTILVESLRAIASEIWSSPSSPIQYAALAAYADDEELSQYVRLCSDLHAVRTRWLQRALVDLGISCSEPRGGFYFLANFDRWDEGLNRMGLRSSGQLAEYLLEKHQLATLPGKAFGIPSEERTLRLASSILDMESDQDASRLMASYLAHGRQLSPADLPNTMAAIARFKEFVATVAS